MVTCPSCGEENPPRFRLCGYCGTPLQPTPPPREVRKTVTVVFSDLAGSTALGERLDPESLRAVMTRYFDAMSGALSRHGGTVEKFIGDAVMAVFGLPQLHEDDALRAVRAAADMQAALKEINDELDARWGVRLTNRTGVNTGEVVAGDPTAGQRLVTGDTVNVAARLEQAAGPDEVLLGDLTWRLVRDHVEGEEVEPLALKGKAERVPAHRLLGLVRRPARVETTDRRLVGRHAELERLEATFADAREQRRARLALVAGGAGVGKSRLTGELLRRVGPEARILTGHCLPYGRGITFWPLREVLQEAAGIQEADSHAEATARLGALLGPARADVTDRLAVAVGFAHAAYPLDELFWAALRLVEALAENGPLVVVLEDLHWAETTFLDLVDHLLASADAPVLLLANARLELIERRDAWMTDPDIAAVTLEPLTEAETAEVLDAVVGGAGLPAAVRDQVVDAAGGNPLFAEQLVSMLVDKGRLVERDGEWVVTGDLAALEMPPTIQALLASRLDALAAPERAVVDPASVIGLVFYPDAVRALAPETVGTELAPRLQALHRKQLVRPADADTLAADTYRFEHSLVRDAAYRALLKRERAQLHEAFVGWLERSGAEELDEVLGYHLEQAHRYLRDLGPLDAHGRALGARAGRLLSAAGRRSFAREDMSAAAYLLRRAAALLPEHDAERLELLPLLAEAYLDLGEFPVARAYVEEALGTAGALGDRRAEARASLVLALVRAHATGGAEWIAEVLENVPGALRVFSEESDEAGAALAWRMAAWAHGTVGRYGAVADAAERVMAHAERAGDDRQRRRAAGQYAIAAVYGPTPVDEAITRCEAIVERERGDRRSVGLTTLILARLNAMRGDVERARTLYREAQAMLQEMGKSVVAASTSLESSGVELLAGDLEAAERELRRDQAQLSEMGERYLLASVAGELARVLSERGDLRAAWESSVMAEGLSAPDDVAAQVLWRSVRARLLALRGEPEAGEQLALDALGRLEGADAHGHRAEVLLELAEVLVIAGRPEEAKANIAEALALLERKGNRVAAAAVRDRWKLGGATASGRSSPSAPRP